MPLLLEPNQRYPVVLDSDKDKPKETRPVFWARAYSARESFANNEVVRGIRSDEEIFEFIKPMILGWDNVPDPQNKENMLPFDVSRIEDVLVTKEGWELFRKINRNDHLSEEDVKKSESQPT